METDRTPTTAGRQVHTNLAFQPHCPICGSANFTQCAQFAEHSYAVFHCASCRYEAIRPQPSAADLLKFYSNYPTTQTSDAHLRFLFDRSEQYFEHILPYARIAIDQDQPLDYLEIGFGNGASLLAAATAGFRALGIDIDEKSVTRVKALADRYGLSVKCVASDINDFHSDVLFDVVKASQVIEHVLDPELFLTNVCKHQPDGGKLILEFPNNDALFWLMKNALRRRYGRLNYYKSLKIDEHLSGFTRRSISILLKKTGYRVLRMHDYPIRHRYLQPENLIWYPSIIDGISQSIVRRDSYALLKSLIPLFDKAASYFAGLGTHMFVLAEKPPAPSPPVGNE